MANINVKLFQIRRSYTAGYRPPTTGATALKAGETLRNYADGLEFHGVGDGSYTTQYLNANVVGDVQGRVPSSKAAFSVRNTAYNADGLLGTSTLVFAGPAVTLGTDTKGPNGFRRFTATATGAVGSGSFWVIDFYDQSTGSNLRHSVVAGQWYEFSVSFPTDTDSNYVAIAWFDASGTDLGSAVSGGFVGASNAISGEVDLFNKSFIIGQAPPNAVSARITAVGINNTAFAAGKVFGVAAPMFARCAPGQAEASRYVETRSVLFNRVVCAKNNAALAATSPLLSPVLRQGYAAPGDCPAVLYTHTASTVTPDGGSAVTATVGGTWLASIPEKAHVGIWGVIADSNGTTGNGTDNTPQLKKAIAWAQKGARTLFFPNTVAAKAVNAITGQTFYRFASPIDNIAGSISFEGEGSETAVSTLYFDHAGRGFDIGAAMPDVASVRFEKLGTWRNQPTPSNTANTTYAPANNDYDIFKPGKGDLTIRDVMMFNPTNGLYVTFGRIVVDGLRGQFLKVGTYIDTVFDTVSFVNFRSWPYWQQNDNVFDYTANNCKTTVWGRVDNPNLVNFFTIYNAYSIYLINTTGDANNPSNPMSRMRISNLDVDGCGRWAIFSELPASTIQIATATAYCTSRPNVKGSGALFLSAAAKDCIVTASGFRSTKSGDAAIRVEGTGCLVQVSSFQVDGYGMVDTAAPVVYCARGSTVDIQSAFNPIATKNFEHAYGSPSGAALYFGGSAYVLTNLDMLALPQASGTVLLHDKASGSMAMYALTNGAVTPIFNTSGSLFVNVNGGTTANVKSGTASGKIGIGFATDTVAASGSYPAMPGSTYRLYNNTGSTVNVYQRFQGSHPNV